MGETLVARLKEAGQRMLRRSMGLDAWPGGKAHIFRALAGMHPVLLLENQLEACQKELEVANEELFKATEKVEELQDANEELTKERDFLKEKSASIEEELGFLKEQGGSLEELERRRKERAEVARQHKEEVDILKAQMKAAEEAFLDQLEGLETQIKVLESRMALMEAAARAKKLNDDDADDAPDDEASRVAPKGQGVMCICCLKQLVHRTVKPLPPKQALASDTASKIDKAKKAFFQTEFQGTLDPSDALHAYAFNTRKDPALKKRPLGASPPNLRASMKDFKPRSFR